MPGTAAGVSPSISWAKTIQHVSKYYPLSDGTYTRTHYLVICRFCKRVAEYSWEETGYQVGSAGTEVIGGNITVNYVATEADIPTDPDTPTDGFTLDGTGFYFSPDDDPATEVEVGVIFGATAEFFPNGSNYDIGGTAGTVQGGYILLTPTPTVITVPADSMSPTDGFALDGSVWYQDPSTPLSAIAVGAIYGGTAVFNLAGDHYFIGSTLVTARTGGYSSVDTDGTKVTMVDTDEAGHDTVRDVTISPSLKTLSDANTWGYLTSGQAGLHPGPALTVPNRGTRYLGHVATDMSSGGLPAFADVTRNTKPAQYAGLTYDPFTGYSYVDLGAQSYVITSEPSFPPFDAPWAQPAEDAYIFSIGHVSGASGPTSDPADPSYIDFLADTVAYNAAMLVYRQRTVDCAIGIVDAASTMMYEKKFSALEPAELMPYEDATDHTLLMAAVVIPARSATQYTFDLAVSGMYPDVTETYAYDSLILPATLPASLYSVTLGASSPAVPAIPQPPWTVTFGNLVVSRYTPATKSFTASTTRPLTRVDFSAGTTIPAVLSQTHALGYTGFYEQSGAVASAAQTTEFAALGSSALAALMEKLCVQQLTLTDLGYIAYYSVNKSGEAVAYRATAHVQTDGSYSVAQSAIST